MTYLLAMLAIVLIGISMTVAAKQWKTVVQREKEADLLMRGIEIQTAIKLYSEAKKLARVMPGEVYALTLEELTKQPKPVLRKSYADPITAGDWEYVRDPLTGGIKGVRSKSTLAALKQHGFPAAVQHFEGLGHYNEWIFQYPNPSVLQTQAASPLSPGTDPAMAPPIPGGAGAMTPPISGGPVPPSFPPGANPVLPPPFPGGPGAMTLPIPGGPGPAPPLPGSMR